LNAIFYVSGVAGVLTFGYACKVLLTREKEPQEADPGVIERQALKDISDIWTAPVLALAEIAHLWRERELEPNTVKLPRPFFNHPEINDFYKGYVAKPYVKGNRRIVIEKLLQMLDEQGDCSSVVGRGVQARGTETEAKYGEESYAYLASIPLWRHSLEVAKCYIRKFQHDTMHPTAMIVSLAHDIGKIPAQYEKFYRKSDHPVTSGLLLMGIPEFTSLGNYEELERAVQCHHDMVTNQHLATLLKEADQEVRKLELAGMLAAATQSPSPPESPSARESGPAGENPDQNYSPSPIDRTSTETHSNPSSSEEIPPLSSGLDNPGITRRQDMGKYVPCEITLPTWVNLDAMLLLIGEHINTVIRDDELKGLWHAYSTTDGYVWVSEKLAWKALKKASCQQVDLLAADGDEALRRNWLYSVVRKLGEQGAVCTAMMKAGYYQVPVCVITGSGKTFTAFFIPFFSRAFGVDAHQLERLKGSQIRGLVKNIVPKILVPK